LKEIDDSFNSTNHAVLEGSLPLKEMYGKFPQYLELMAVIRNIYGDDFMDIFEKSFKDSENG